MRDHNDYDLICIGCGPAGEKAATQAAYFGKRVAIIEKCARPGGAMANTGTVPSKALRETALRCSANHRCPLPGQPTNHAPLAIDHGLSIHRFMAHRHLIEQQEHDRIESSIDRHGIDVHRGTARLIDPHTMEITRADGESYEVRSEFILIATGSSPHRPAAIPFDLPGVVDADGVLELEHLPRSMIIVGGGVIGCEYASIFAEIDVQVTLIHPRDAILPFLDDDCRTRLVRAMRTRGITLQLNDSVEAVEASETGEVAVHCKSGATLESDVLLWAAGRNANTHGLNLPAVGVELGERGLTVVDDDYRTNVPSIYAAGDVIGFPALAATSMEQGRVAACSMFGIDFKSRLARTIPIGLYTIPGVSMVGLTEREAIELNHDVVCGRAEFRSNVRGRMLGDETGLVKCIFDRKSRTLLGAAIVGEDATELIHLAQSAIVHGAGIDYFIDCCFNYPSLSEMYKYAAYDALQQIARGEREGPERTGLAA